MKIQTYSVLVGSKACNAHCPYCVSQMTPNQGIKQGVPKINWRNFEIGCNFAKDSGVSTVLLTGKGEPTLFPDLISEFLFVLEKYRFPFIELQTNGIRLPKMGEYLLSWYSLGLTILAISIVHYEDKKNEEIFRSKEAYPNLVSLISFLHSIGFSVRLSCMMFKGAIDSPQGVKKLIQFAQKNKVEQLTIRSIENPAHSENSEISEWVIKHKLSQKEIDEIRLYLTRKGTPIMNLVHGAIVYDVNGQNVCLANCLTNNPSSDEVRQLIFFSDGHLRYDWQYPGAVLL